MLGGPYSKIAVVFKYLIVKIYAFQNCVPVLGSESLALLPLVISHLACRFRLLRVRVVIPHRRERCYQSPFL